VAEPGTLLLLPVDTTQHRVDVDETQRVGTLQQRGPPGQFHQHVTPGGLQLPAVPVGELAQELAQRRGRVHRREQRAHAPIPGQVQIVDAVRAGDHARHDGGYLARRVGALVPGDTHPGGHRAVQAGVAGQPHHRHQPGTRHQIRIIKPSAHNRRPIT
jgi:hypothetical protein